MPHIRVHGMKKDLVQKLSLQFSQALAPVMGTEEDNFTIEHVETEYFRNGKSVDADPYIEVLWFDRGQIIQDQSAEKITELVKQVSSAISISVVFTALPKTSYYENGQHF